MKRRTLLGLLGFGALGAAGWRYWPDQGFINPCLGEPLPDALFSHDVVQSALEGLEPEKLWDCHVHLLGVGDGNDGGRGRGQ